MIFTFCQPFSFYQWKPLDDHTSARTESRTQRVDNHFEAAARLITLPALHPQALCCIMATASSAGKTKAWSSETSVLRPSLRHRSVCGPQAAVCTDGVHHPKCSHNNGSKWHDTQNEDPHSTTAHLTHCQLNYGWMHLTKAGQKQTKLQATVCLIYETLNESLYSMRLSVYLSNASSPLPMIYSSTFHWSHQLCAGLPHCHPSGQPFIWYNNATSRAFIAVTAALDVTAPLITLSPPKSTRFDGNEEML